MGRFLPALGTTGGAAASGRERWRVSVGAIEQDLLPPAITRAWERCHGLRTDARRVRSERLEGAARARG